MAGVLPGLALSQQIDVNGQPLKGALLYMFAIGTVATPQNMYSDFALTQLLPNPLPADTTGRIPMFYLADGSVHARLTDANGVVIFDAPNIQVVGPSNGGGGGGGSGVDPTAVASTGDVKFRPTTETLSGWVKMNALTIGSATSGATGRANADTQNLFVYLWQNFTNDKCPVIGGRGASALADFQANKQITMPDWRSRGPMGLDDMGNVAANIIQSSNVTSQTAGVNDTPTTPAAFGGEANHTLVTNEIPAHNHTTNENPHTHGVGGGQFAGTFLGDASGGSAQVPYNGTQITIQAAVTGITINNTGGGAAHQNMQPFVLGSWHMKL
jgi:hypothetical protein